MIFTKKTMNIKYTETSNPLRDVMNPLYNRQGYSSNTSKPNIPIYFIRYIGVPSNESIDQYLLSINSLIQSLNKDGICHRLFKNSLSETQAPSNLLKDLEAINKKHRDLSFDTLDAYIGDLLNHKKLQKPTDSYVSATCEYEFYRVVHNYINNEAHINITMTKNFVLKLFGWCTSYLPIILKGFLIKGKYNPKVIYIGNIRKHEKYFLTYLASIGCDIIYINSTEDLLGNIPTNSIKIQGNLRAVDYKTINDSIPNKASTQKSSIIKPTRTTRTKSTSTPSNTTSTINTIRIKKANITDINHAINKEANDIWKEFSSPLSERVGFVKDNCNTIPRFFYLVYGVDANINIYNNRLFNLAKSVEQYPHIRFDGTIKLGYSKELINSSKGLWESIKDHNISTDKIIDLLYSYKCLDLTSNIVFNNTIASALAYVINVYKDKNANVNLSQIKNLTLKILTWAYQYIPQLFKSIGYDFTNSHNPKVIYWGEIKKHETLFLVFLSMLGCDVIYINPVIDDKFNWIPTINTLTHTIKYDFSKSLDKYPDKEFLVRNETVAYQASREIGEIIHNNDDGVFKPWQFEEYMIQPSTLKTTYDEVFILWNESPRVRSGFEIKNGTVYIPNIFCKVSGVHEDIQLFWKELQTVVNNNFTHFEDSLPFTKEQYQDSHMYSFDYLLNRDGSLNKDEVKKSTLYKYGYLRLSLQDTILNKIEQLFDYNGFKETIDRNFKKRILKNVLTLDKHIVDLINKFDYPFGNPKLVIYDKDENMFSIDDIIIILFLSLMCFDIVIFTPTGYNNIERDVNKTKFDVHKLQKNKFNLDIPARLLNPNSDSNDKKGKSLWSSFFGI